MLLLLAGCSSDSDQDNTAEVVVLEVDSVALNAQNETLPSPRRTVSGKIGETTIIVDWGSPAVNNREIWGGLVPFDEIWRAGANENTTISFSTDVVVNGERVSAGKYGFFVIPSDSPDWTIILSSKNDAWGHFEYSKSEDVVRTLVRVENSSVFSERLQYEVLPDGILFSWADKQLLIPVIV